MIDIQTRAYRAAFGGPLLNEEDLELAEQEVVTRWEYIQEFLEWPSFYDKLKLMFTPEFKVSLPKIASKTLRDYEVTDMLGHPKYLFKYSRGKHYFYGCVPSPGFPGS